MQNVYIKEVKTGREMDDFVHLPRRLYAGNPYYVPDLESDIRETFDPQKNAALEFSDIQAFMAYDEAGTPVGRIAGIINHRANEKWHTRNVRFGFIEFVDDLAVPASLLRAVEDWGRSRGMDTVVGPMGIFDFDKEGMLVEDFDQLGSSITIYNPPYYPRHLEALGYVSPPPGGPGLREGGGLGAGPHRGARRGARPLCPHRRPGAGDVRPARAQADAT